MSNATLILAQLAQALRTRAGEWLLQADGVSSPGDASNLRIQSREAAACAELVDQALEAERETVRGRLASQPYFAVVEIIGRARRRYVGRITEVEVLGVAYLQVEEPIEGDPANGLRIHRVPERAIFGVAIVDEETARAFHRPRVAPLPPPDVDYDRSGCEIAPREVAHG